MDICSSVFNCTRCSQRIIIACSARIISIFLRSETVSRATRGDTCSLILVLSLEKASLLIRTKIATFFAACLWLAVRFHVTDHIEITKMFGNYRQSLSVANRTRTKISYCFSSLQFHEINDRAVSNRSEITSYLWLDPIATIILLPTSYLRSCFLAACIYTSAH